MGAIEDKLIALQTKLTQTFRRLPPIIGEEVVNFSLDNFERQGWQGEQFEPWAKRKNPTKWGKKDEDDRAILVKTGQGRRSIRVGNIEEDKVQVIAGGQDTPYMRVHNEGFKGPVKQHVREHFRRTRKLKDIKVKAHDRTINQDIPKRQFIGESPVLNKRIVDAVISELNKTVKDL